MTTTITIDTTDFDAAMRRRKWPAWVRRYLAEIESNLVFDQWKRVQT